MAILQTIHRKPAIRRRKREFQIRSPTCLWLRLLWIIKL